MDVDQNFLVDLTVLAFAVLAVWGGMLKMRDVMYEHRRRTRERNVGVRASLDKAAA